VHSPLVVDHQQLTAAEDHIQQDGGHTIGVPEAQQHKPIGTVGVKGVFVVPFQRRG
jgi:hypothetical protein